MITNSNHTVTKKDEKEELLIMEKTQLRHQLDKVNNKLLNSENLKSNFLSNIRNEINNPLASVLELSKNIATGDFKPEQIKKFANLIHSEIFNLDFQLRNILFSAEIEAGDIGISFAQVNILTIVQNVIDSFKHVVEKKNIQIELIQHLNTEKSFITDPEKLHLIISNILSNAIQFSNEGGKIGVSIQRNDNKIGIGITDNGIGITEENLKLIFDRFRQGDEGSTKFYAGHGLGLSVCKALLDLIEGTIDVVSEPKKGSQFMICVKEADQLNGAEPTFSTDGNDFLFDDIDSAIF